MQGGGHDRAWYESLDEDGNRDLDLGAESLGCHVGPYRGLNVINPQPNFEYAWANNDPRDILKARALGGQIVQGEDPEFAAYRALGDSTNSQIDSVNLYQDCILIRTPIEKVRERREAERQKAEISVRGSIEDFTERASNAETQAGRQYGPTRFARHDHSIEWEEDGRTSSMWTPGSGIVRR